MTNAIRDENHIPVWLGVSSVDGVTPTPILTDLDGHMLMENGVSVMPVISSLKTYVPRDTNFQPVLAGVSNTDSAVVIPVSVNPSTGALQVQAS